MKAVASILAFVGFLPYYGAPQVELTFKDVGTKSRPQAKVFLVVGGKSTAITTVLGTVFKNSLISDRSWIPAGAVSALGSIRSGGESQLYVLHMKNSYQVYARTLNHHLKKTKFQLMKTVKA
jgi:hypothetical protein